MLYLNSKGVIDVNYNEKKFGNKELEFAIFCIENVADKLNIDAPKVYSMLTEQTNILNEYIIPEYEILHTQSKDYIVDDIIEVMKESRCGNMILYHGSFIEINKPDLKHSRPNVDFGKGFILLQYTNKR